MGNGASTISVGSTVLKKPLVFIEFAKFKAHGSIPRNPECDSLCNHVDMEDVDRDQAFLIFVSHVWIQDKGDGDPTPDDCHDSKYKLIVNGITRLIRECAPTVKKCYLWCVREYMENIQKGCCILHICHALLWCWYGVCSLIPRQCL